MNYQSALAYEPALELAFMGCIGSPTTLGDPECLLGTVTPQGNRNTMISRVRQLGRLSLAKETLAEHCRYCGHDSPFYRLGNCGHSFVQQRLK